MMYACMMLGVLFITIQAIELNHSRAEGKRLADQLQKLRKDNASIQAQLKEVK